MFKDIGPCCIGQESLEADLKNKGTYQLKQGQLRPASRSGYDNYQEQLQ